MRFTECRASGSDYCYRPGEYVVAAKDIGGLLRDWIGADTCGIVTETSRSGRPSRVAFREGRHLREIRVYRHEVRPAIARTSTKGGIDRAI